MKSRLFTHLVVVISLSLPFAVSSQSNKVNVKEVRDDPFAENIYIALEFGTVDWFFKKKQYDVIPDYNSNDIMPTMGLGINVQYSNFIDKLSAELQYRKSMLGSTGTFFDMGATWDLLRSTNSISQNVYLPEGVRTVNYLSGVYVNRGTALRARGGFTYSKFGDTFLNTDTYEYHRVDVSSTGVYAGIELSVATNYVALTKGVKARHRNDLRLYADIIYAPLGGYSPTNKNGVLPDDLATQLDSVGYRNEFGYLFGMRYSSRVAYRFNILLDVRFGKKPPFDGFYAFFTTGLVINLQRNIIRKEEE